MSWQSYAGSGTSCASQLRCLQGRVPDLVAQVAYFQRSAFFPVKTCVASGRCLAVPKQHLVERLEHVDVPIRGERLGGAPRSLTRPSRMVIQRMSKSTWIHFSARSSLGRIPVKTLW